MGNLVPIFIFTIFLRIRHFTLKYGIPPFNQSINPLQNINCEKYWTMLVGIDKTLKPTLEWL